MARKKKLIKGLLITDIADKGKAMGKTEDGQVVFVDGVVPGDIVDVLILRKKKNYAEGVVDQIVKFSDARIKPACDHFGACGGCKWQNLKYEAQLKFKEKVVKDAMIRIAKLKNDVVKPIVGCEHIFQYRNKLEYSSSTKRWLTKEEIVTSDVILDDHGALGFHKSGFFDKIVSIDECLLQENFTNTLRNFVRSYIEDNQLTMYDIRQHTGFLRNIVVRNTTDGQWMVIMVFGENDTEHIENLMNTLKSKFNEITSLYYVVNTKFNDTTFDLDYHLWFGLPYISQSLGNVKYKIGPKSFFQTNPKQAENLFNIAVKYAEIKPTDTVYDLYTGLGSIALYVSGSAHQVIGIEEIPEAIEDAKINVNYNEIHNAIFYAGDVKEILNKTFFDKHAKADVVITDPPRAGMHTEVVETLLNLEAHRIVYISCNPATQARDLQLLSAKYDVDEVTPVDMFPHTHHIESVAKLTLKSSLS